MLIRAILMNLHPFLVQLRYISDAMQGMDDKFKANKKVCFNEVGVDPGLDHM